MRAPKKESSAVLDEPAANDRHKHPAIERTHKNTRFVADSGFTRRSCTIGVNLGYDSEISVHPTTTSSDRTRSSGSDDTDTAIDGVNGPPGRPDFASVHTRTGASTTYTGAIYKHMIHEKKQASASHTQQQHHSTARGSCRKPSNTDKAPTHYVPGKESTAGGRILRQVWYLPTQRVHPEAPRCLLRNSVCVLPLS